MSVEGKHGGPPLFRGYPTELTKTREGVIGGHEGLLWRVATASLKANYAVPGVDYQYGDRVVTTTSFWPRNDVPPYHTSAFMGGGYKFSYPPHWPGARAPASVTFNVLDNVVRDSIPCLTGASSEPYRYPNVMVTDGVLNYRFAPTLSSDSDARLYAIVAMKADEGIEAYVYDDISGRYPGAIDLTTSL